MLLRPRSGICVELSCKEATSYARFAGREKQLGGGRGGESGGGDVGVGPVLRAARYKDGAVERRAGNRISRWNSRGGGLSLLVSPFLLKTLLCRFSPTPPSVSVLMSGPFTLAARETCDWIICPGSVTL